MSGTRQKANRKKKNSSLERSISRILRARIGASMSGGFVETENFRGGMGAPPRFFPCLRRNPILEGQLQAELNQSAAWGRDEPGDVAGASRKDVEPRSIKMGLVEEIKNLRPKLHIDPLG